MLGERRELRSGQQVDPYTLRQRSQLMHADEVHGGGGMSRVHASASRRRPQAAGGDLRLLFEGVGGPVLFSDCPEVVRLLPAILPTWPCATETGRGRPLIAVSGVRSGYRIAARDRTRPIFVSGAASALCRLAADLVTAFVNRDRSLICLHAAAAEFDGKLIVFPSTYRAGKSTLVAALAENGVPVHADDVLPIDKTGLGVALGIAPRLRLPLPETVERALGDLPANHRGPCDTRYLYLSLPGPLLSPFGRRFPLGAFVVLDRRPGTGPRLAPMSADEMLGRVIARNFAAGPRSAEIVDRLAEVVGARPCLSLSYFDPSVAAAALRAEFGGGVPNVARSEAPSAIKPTPAPCRASIPAGQRYRRQPGIVARSFGGSDFLADRASGAIHRLNATGAVVWCLLRRPTSLVEAAALIAQAFPKEQRRHIERDIEGLFGSLRRARLIAVVEEPAKAHAAGSPRGRPTCSSAIAVR